MSLIPPPHVPTPMEQLEINYRDQLIFKYPLPVCTICPQKDQEIESLDKEIVSLNGEIYILKDRIKTKDDYIAVLERGPPQESAVAPSPKRRKIVGSSKDALVPETLPIMTTTSCSLLIQTKDKNTSRVNAKNIEQLAATIELWIPVIKSQGERIVALEREVTDLKNDY